MCHAQASCRLQLTVVIVNRAAMNINENTFLGLEIESLSVCSSATFGPYDRSMSNFLRKCHTDF